MRQCELPTSLVKKRTRKALHRRRQKEKTRRATAIAQARSKHFASAVTLRAPAYFHLAETSRRDTLVEFLRTLTDAVLQDGKRICIDFRHTLRLFPEGTLLFYAELDRILKRRPGTISCLVPRAPVARQVLSHLGILKMLGHLKTYASRRDDVTHWDLFFGTKADATQGVGDAIDRLPRMARSQIRKLFRSVTEALTNVTQHAYTSPRMDGTGLISDGGWWMFVRQEPSYLTVTFCDLGLGVPHTVPLLQKHESWFSRRIAPVVKALSGRAHHDGETIKVTVEEKRSRFKANHRGNGFGNMLESIDASGRGRLIIYSNRGSYVYDLERGKTTEGTLNYHESIFGTVVAWVIWLPEQD